MHTSVKAEEHAAVIAPGYSGERGPHAVQAPIDVTTRIFRGRLGAVHRGGCVGNCGCKGPCVVLALVLALRQW